MSRTYSLFTKCLSVSPAKLSVLATMTASCSRASLVRSRCRPDTWQVEAAGGVREGGDCLGGVGGG
jgi:hypothetical protein